MLSLMKDWEGLYEVDGHSFDSFEALKSNFKPDENGIRIVLRHKVQTSDIEQSNAPKQYRIKVKPYMLRKATPEFDFMAKWNNDEPMPLCIMTGWVEKETRGMLYMHLHGEMYADRMTVCMKCGKPLTNPVSQYFGIGPECGNHGYVNPFDSDEELRAAVESYKKQLQSVTWSGWVIRSSIIESEEV